MKKLLILRSLGRISAIIYVLAFGRFGSKSVFDGLECNDRCFVGNSSTGVVGTNNRLSRARQCNFHRIPFLLFQIFRYDKIRILRKYFRTLGFSNTLFLDVGSSVLYNPWYVLPLQPFDAITSSLGLTAAHTYGAKLSTLSTDGSIQGLLSCLHFGVGKLIKL